MRNGTGLGSLWVYADGARPVQVLFDHDFADNGFHPMGIDSLASDPTQLLVVNHGIQQSTIEQFHVTLTAPYRARHVRTYAHPKIVSPNAVAWTSPSSFYITQDHRWTRRSAHGRVLSLLETLVLPGMTEVSHVTTTTMTTKVTRAVGGLAFPNGVSVSASGERVAVASSSQFAVYFYNRDPVSHRLTLNTSVEVPMAPDNVHFADEKTLIVAGHPNYLALSAVAAGAKGVVSPSWVLSISDQGQVKTLYRSDGVGFGSSSAGLWDQRTQRLFVVGLYQEGLLVCNGG